MTFALPPSPGGRREADAAHPHPRGVGTLYAGAGHARSAPAPLFETGGLSQTPTLPLASNAQPPRQGAIPAARRADTLRRGIVADKAVNGSNSFHHGGNYVRFGRETSFNKYRAD